MSEKYCDADKRECEIHLSGIYNLNCQRCGYLRALADAKAAVAVRLAVKLTGIKMGEPFSSKMSNEIFKGIIDAIEALEVKP